MAFTVEISNLDDVLRRFDKYPVKARDAIFMGMERTAFEVKNEARTEAPKDTTTLANSIQITDKNKAELSLTVQTTQPSRKYAAFQEFGWFGPMGAQQHTRQMTHVFGTPVTPFQVTVSAHLRLVDYAGKGYMKSGAELGQRRIGPNVENELERVKL